ncbi:uncharacterized protein TM35_000801010, partial [Trypanosoma theileri]
EQDTPGTAERHPLYALPSLREGATRHLGTQRMSEEHRMSTTWHTRIDTLRRYLGNHLQMTREAEHAQDNDVRALLRAEFPGNTAPRTREHRPKFLSSKTFVSFDKSTTRQQNINSSNNTSMQYTHWPLHLKDATPPQHRGRPRIAHSAYSCQKLPGACATLYGGQPFSTIYAHPEPSRRHSSR